MVRAVVNLAVAGMDLSSYHAWILSVYQRRGYNRAAVAVANKNARILWALLKREGSVFSPPGKAPKMAA